MALPTRGRVIVDTTVGELDIELWSKETPKACRNFIALAMEGYYDGVIFHRVVPDFLVQTGDRTGTGAGGESFYGEPFEDEVHPRLRFTHRGLVGMANNGSKNSNDSQFFITLDRADELNGKHTLFGRCVGDTIFNVMKINNLELDENERPLYPPKIKTVRILDNPFPDIVPRITAAEKRAQQLARQHAQKEREEEIRRKSAKKNTKLLSFQDEGEAADNDLAAPIRKKPIVRPDLIETPKESLTVPDFASSSGTNMKKDERKSSIEKDKETAMPVKAEVDITDLRGKHAKERTAEEKSRQAQIEQLEKDIRRMAEKRAGEVDSDEERSKKKAKGHSHLEEELAKYEQLRGVKGKKSAKGKRKDEGDILAKMDAFRGKLKGSFVDEAEDVEEADEKGVRETPPETSEKPEDSMMEVDNDTGFLSHRLHFPKDNIEEVNKAERDYEVIDPRQRGARAREEERERKQRQHKGKGGPRHLRR